MEELTNEEFQGWSLYFERQPPEWRDDLRAYYIMSSMSGGKTKPEDIFPSIKQVKQAENSISKEEQEMREQKKMRDSLKASPFAAFYKKEN